MKNIFCIFGCLVRRKIIVNGKYFPFGRKFFFSFQNRKLFFDSELLILKSMDLAKTRPGPCQDLTRTCSRLNWDPLGTYLGLD